MTHCLSYCFFKYFEVKCRDSSYLRKKISIIEQHNNSITTKKKSTKIFYKTIQSSNFVIKHCSIKTGLEMDMLFKANALF